MTYYHVRITLQGEQQDEVKNDISEEVLEAQFLRPYRSGGRITVNGKTIPSDQLARIMISSSEAQSEQIIQQLKYEDQRSSVTMIRAPSYEWRAADKATDVTDQFITGPPGTEIPSAPASHGAVTSDYNPSQVSGPGDKRSVFIVSGRDHEAVAAVVAVLRAMDLRIIEWSHAVNRTGVPNPYTGQVVATGLRMADATVVIITPDDVVRLRRDLFQEGDGEIERALHGQARPNVIYEAGYADALGPDRTLIIEIGNVKSFSDIAGRHTLRYDGSASRRKSLAERLRLAGLEPNTDGDDWLRVGSVNEVVTRATKAIIAERGEG